MGLVLENKRLFFIPQLDNLIELFVLLHESGHVQQYADTEFMTREKRLSFSNSEKWRERNASARAIQFLRRLQQVGIDLRKSFQLPPDLEKEVSAWTECASEEDENEAFETKRMHMCEQSTVTMMDFLHLALESYDANRDKPGRDTPLTLQSYSKKN